MEMFITNVAPDRPKEILGMPRLWDDGPASAYGPPVLTTLQRAANAAAASQAAPSGPKQAALGMPRLFDDGPSAGSAPLTNEEKEAMGLERFWEATATPAPAAPIQQYVPPAPAVNPWQGAAGGAVTSNQANQAKEPALGMPGLFS